MKVATVVVVTLACALGMTAKATAQTEPSRSVSDYQLGYAQGLVQSSFGTVTSQSFGGEIGFNVGRSLRVFVEAGRARDAARPTLGPSAQIIASYLAQTQTGAVSFSVKQPVAFGLGGIRYVFPYDEDFEPYVMGGLGVARDTRAVRFSIAGTDVTDAIGQHGVVLGTDLSGSSMNVMVSLGGGLVWNAFSPLFVDLHYRYGRILSDGATGVDGAGINLNRAGIGVGMRF